jgi:hypothetical protein
MNKRPPSNARVDERVYLTMGSLTLLSLLILAFRYASHRPCAPIILRVSSGSFIRGSLVNFNADTRGGSSYEWNFGDGTGSKGADPSAGHNYSVAGRYTVSVTVNGECTELQNVVIKEAPVIINNSLQPVIVVPDTVYMNVPLTVEDISPSSTSWEWRFEQGGLVDQTTRKASHTYSTPGPKQIFLEVNGRPDLQVSRWTMVIDRNAAIAAAKAAAVRAPAAQGHVTVIAIDNKPTVQPLGQQAAAPPPVKPAEAAKAPEISSEDMATMLKGISESGKTTADFSSYLCGNLNIQVFYNKDKMTFTQMCDDIKGIKKGRIKSIKVLITKDQQNCIVTLNVTLEKSKKFGIF